MKKIIILVGTILCLFSLTSCTREIKEIHIYSFLASSPIIIQNEEEITKFKKMILDQKYEKDKNGLFESIDGGFYRLLFLDEKDCTVGKSEYLITSSGYIFYLNIIGDEEVSYVSKSKIDYNQFLSMLK